MEPDGIRINLTCFRCSSSVCLLPKAASLGQNRELAFPVSVTPLLVQRVELSVEGVQGSEEGGGAFNYPAFCCRHIPVFPYFYTPVFQYCFYDSVPWKENVFAHGLGW